MRYAKGSLSLNRKEDKFVLEFVADSRYVARSQLFEFARLEYGEYNRPVFNWRMTSARLVEFSRTKKLCRHCSEAPSSRLAAWFVGCAKTASNWAAKSRPVYSAR